jgi:hypothetical protein
VDEIGSRLCPGTALGISNVDPLNSTISFKISCYIFLKLTVAFRILSVASSCCQ